MKKIIFLALFFVSGCATALTYNEDCFNLNDNFDNAVMCVKEKIATDPRSSSILSYTKYNNMPPQTVLFSFMDMISEQVKSKKISPIEGRYRISQKIMELTNIKLRSTGSQNSMYTLQDNRVYTPDECIGAVIMGKCTGSVMDQGGYHKTCYGQWLNGQCTGPLF